MTFLSFFFVCERIYFIDQKVIIEFLKSPINVVTISKDFPARWGWPASGSSIRRWILSCDWLILRLCLSILINNGEWFAPCSSFNRYQSPVERDSSDRPAVWSGSDPRPRDSECIDVKAPPDSWPRTQVRVTTTSREPGSKQASVRGSCDCGDEDFLRQRTAEGNPRCGAAEAIDKARWWSPASCQ